MSNKLILILLAGLLALSLDAQSFRSRRRTRQTSRQSQTTTAKEQSQETVSKKQARQATKKTTEKSSSQSGTSRFKKPGLTRNYINYVLDNEIKKQLLERKIAPRLPKTNTKQEDDEDSETQVKEKEEKFRFFSQIDLTIHMASYRNLLKHFELTEVSMIPLSWYKQLEGELDKFMPVIGEMSLAIQDSSDSRYQAAAAKFKAHQAACLKFLKEPKPKISKEQYEDLVKKNTQIRLEKYRKQQAEKRRAALQRQQEQFKKLQQKSQGNQKPAQGAGK